MKQYKECKSNMVFIRGSNQVYIHIIDYSKKYKKGEAINKYHNVLN